jgi:hypothetical protein
MSSHRICAIPRRRATSSRGASVGSPRSSKRWMRYLPVPNRRRTVAASARTNARSRSGREAKSGRVEMSWSCSSNCRRRRITPSKTSAAIFRAANPGASTDASAPGSPPRLPRSAVPVDICARDISPTGHTSPAAVPTRGIRRCRGAPAEASNLATAPRQACRSRRGRRDRGCPHCTCGCIHRRRSLRSSWGYWSHGWRIRRR